MIDWVALLRPGIKDRATNPFYLVETTGDGEAWKGYGGLSVIWSVAEELDGRHWLHVSAARPRSLPSYLDMKRIKELFVGPDRVAYSVWATASEHITIHDNCLHLWAPLEGEPPLPDFTRGTGSI